MMARLLKEYTGGKYPVKDRYITVGPETDMKKLPAKYRWLTKEKLVVKPDQLIKRVGMCSGGGTPNQDEFADLVEKGIDLYISGEIKESRPHVFGETKMAYFSCGHYATERIGVLELEKNIKKEFPSIKTKFIEIYNPL